MPSILHMRRMIKRKKGDGNAKILGVAYVAAFPVTTATSSIIWAIRFEALNDARL
jgi:uncharacterized membrane protein